MDILNQDGVASEIKDNALSLNRRKLRQQCGNGVLNMKHRLLSKTPSSTEQLCRSLILGLSFFWGILASANADDASPKKNFRQCAPPAIENASGYNQARSIILKAGYRPAPTNDNLETRETSDCHPKKRWYAEACAAYPEIQACSGTGVGYCKMQFVNSNEDILEIITAGGLPDAEFDIGVVGVMITCVVWR